MRDTAPVLITSIFEINVGIIVGCMPHLAPMMRKGVLKLAHVCSISNIRSFLTEHLPFLRTSKRLTDEPTDDLANSPDLSSDHKAYLETKMLGSVDGKGKFVKSGTFPQRGWLQKSTMNGQMDEELATTAHLDRKVATAV